MTCGQNSVKHIVSDRENVVANGSMGNNINRSIRFYMYIVKLKVCVCVRYRQIHDPTIYREILCVYMLYGTEKVFTKDILSKP